MTRAFTNSPTLSGASLLLSPAKENVRGGLRVALCALFALGALAVALTAAPAAQAQSDRVQVIRLTVGNTPVTWQSHYRLREITTVSIRANGHMLTNWDAHGAIGYDSGHGVLVKFDGHGNGPQPMRITAVSLNGTAQILIRYTYQR